MQTTSVAISCPAQRHPPRRTALPRSIGLSLGLVTILLSGCAGHSVTVGAIPDDYRTNHPIIVAEKERVFDLPVASGDRQLTVSMRESIRGVANDYRSSASGTVRIMAPSGSINAGAASLLVRQVADVLRREGVPGNRIISTLYQAGSVDDAAPIRISFMAITASTSECGHWSEDMLAKSEENRHYGNFGCASQNNLAAQIANPGDLLAPRGATPIDAARRANVIDSYRANGAAL